MWEDCSEKVSKCMLVFFNLAFFIVGLSLIAFSCMVMQFSIMQASLLAEKEMFYLFMYIGAVMALVSGWGCVGVFCENYGVLVAHAAILALMVALELLVGVMAFVNRHKAWPYTEKMLRQSMRQYFAENGQAVVFAWDHLQRTFNCCGLDSRQDWERTGALAGSVPTSCGRPGDFQPGCSDIIMKAMDTLGTYLMVGGGLLIGIELIGMVSSFCLSRCLAAKQLLSDMLTPSMRSMASSKKWKNDCS